MHQSMRIDHVFYIAGWIEPSPEEVKCVCEYEIGTQSSLASLLIEITQMEEYSAVQDLIGEKILKTSERSMGREEFTIFWKELLRFPRGSEPLEIFRATMQRGFSETATAGGYVTFLREWQKRE